MKSLKDKITGKLYIVFLIIAVFWTAIFKFFNLGCQLCDQFRLRTSRSVQFQPRQRVFQRKRDGCEATACIQRFPRNTAADRSSAVCQSCEAEHLCIEACRITARGAERTLRIMRKLFGNDENLPCTARLHPRSDLRDECLRILF